MAKLKTNKGARKRFFKISKKGKIKRGQAYKRHILTSKKRKAKRQMRSSAYVAAVDTKKTMKLLPYG